MVKAMAAVRGCIRVSLEQQQDTMGWKILCDMIVSTSAGGSGADNAKARGCGGEKSRGEVRWSKSKRWSGVE